MRTGPGAPEPLRGVPGRPQIPCARARAGSRGAGPQAPTDAVRQARPGRALRAWCARARAVRHARPSCAPQVPCARARAVRLGPRPGPWRPSLRRPEDPDRQAPESGTLRVLCAHARTIGQDAGRGAPGACGHDQARTPGAGPWVPCARARAVGQARPRQASPAPMCLRTPLRRARSSRPLLRHPRRRPLRGPLGRPGRAIR
jgi:hypothetical protein